MDHLTIGEENDRCLTFDLPVREAKGRVTTYRVGVRAPGLSSALEVDNHPGGEPPTQLFASMAAQWRGWNGELKWRALEGEYNLAASTDSSGHVTLSVTLTGSVEDGYWSATIPLSIEAGMLDRLDQQVRAFFGPDA
jgi:hypothetical protein